MTLNPLTQQFSSQNYFEQACSRYQKQPFEDDRAKANFPILLENWSNSHSLETRRQFYRVDTFLSEEQIAEAPAVCTITAQNGHSIHVYLFRDPINQYEVDAVINPANETLLGGGGADKEIHDGAGPNLVKECAYLHGCEVGEAKITKGYDLPAKYVIHTVGPLLNENGSPNIEALETCYRSCFALCDKYHLKSIAAPCVACGFYAFPVEVSAQIVRSVIQEICGHTSVEKIVLSVPKDNEWQAYYKVFG